MLPSVPLIGNASLDAGGNAARTRARAAVEPEIATVRKLVDSFFCRLRIRFRGVKGTFAEVHILKLTEWSSAAIERMPGSSGLLALR